jgi:phage anti-repressor protein
MDLSIRDENDALFQLMKSKMTTNEEQMFLMSHYLYLQHGTDSTAFVVDFDDVWKNVEFTTRANAKRVLVKKFSENVDYTISVRVACSRDEIRVENVQYSFEKAAHQSGGAAHQSGGAAHQSDVLNVTERGRNLGGAGLNKETILLTVDCFKQFCFLAATPKAKEIRTYYIKMENVMHEYYKNLQNKNNLLENSLQVSQHETAIERHKVLIDTHKNKWLVYFCKVQTNPDSSFILKVGETTNIKNRMEGLKADFGMDVAVLDVFVCENSLKLEKTLHESDKFLKYKYKQLERKNKKFSTEAYCIPTQKEYEKLVAYTKQEMYKYNDVDRMKLAIELKQKSNDSEKMNLISSLLPICKNHEELMSILNKIFSPEQINTRSNEDQQAPTVLTQQVANEDVSEEEGEQEQEQEEEEENSFANASGPIVQIYHKNDCKTLVQTYPSILEATRQFNYENKTASFSAIKKAYQNKTIYLDHRWHFIMDRKEPDLDKPRNIGETVVTIEKNQGQVAMLNLDKTKVIQVFRLAKDAAKEILQHPSAMSTAIKHSVPLNNHYWMRWQYVDPSLKRQFLQSSTLPNKESNPRGIKINVLKSDTNELIKTFGSFTEIQKEMKISIKNVKYCIERNAVCRGQYKFATA